MGRHWLLARTVASTTTTMQTIAFSCLVLAASAAFVPAPVIKDVDSFLATGAANSASSAKVMEDKLMNELTSANEREVNFQQKIENLEAEKAVMAAQVQKLAAQLASSRSTELEGFLDGHSRV